MSGKGRKGSRNGVRGSRKGISGLVQPHHGDARSHSGKRSHGVPSTAAMESLTQTGFHQILHTAMRGQPDSRRQAIMRDAARKTLGEMVRGGKETARQRIKEIAFQLSKLPKSHSQHVILRARLERHVVLYEMAYGQRL